MLQERFSSDGSSVHGSTRVYQSLPDLPGGLVPSNTGSDSLSLQLYLRNLWVDRIPGLPDLIWSGCEAPGNIPCFVGITPVHSQRSPRLLMEGTRLDWSPNMSIASSFLMMAQSAILTARLSSNISIKVMQQFTSPGVPAPLQGAGFYLFLLKFYKLHTEITHWNCSRRSVSCLMLCILIGHVLKH